MSCRATCWPHCWQRSRLQCMPHWSRLAGPHRCCGLPCAGQTMTAAAGSCPMPMAPSLSVCSLPACHAVWRVKIWAYMACCSRPSAVSAVCSPPCGCAQHAQAAAALRSGSLSVDMLPAQHQDVTGRAAYCSLGWQLSWAWQQLTHGRCSARRNADSQTLLCRSCPNCPHQNW